MLNHKMGILNEKLVEVSMQLVFGCSTITANTNWVYVVLIKYM